MSRPLSEILCIFILCILSLSVANAQKKAVGTTFSYAGMGMTYEHSIDDESFIDVQLRMETSSMFTGRGNPPGISASFTWNMVFAHAESRDGSRIDFFAGPGVMAGLGADIGRAGGVFAGMKGRIGGECTFKRKVSVSLSIAPVLGVHISRKGSMLNMLLYKNGLMYGIMPEVGIKYAF